VAIEGRVVDDETGLGLRRVTVQIRPVDGGLPGLSVSADEYGRFTVRDIRPGSYRLEARRDGYLPGTVARRDGYRLPPIVYLDSSQRWTGIEFRLRRWSVIAGHIRYDDAEPAAGASVQVYRALRYRGRVSYQLAGSAITNDRGEYRVFGLPPGVYYVAASSREQPSENVTEQARRSRSGVEEPLRGYPTMFYPNTYRLTEAAAVRVDPGQETGSIDIDLQPARRVRVRGQVTSGITGRVLNNASVSVYRLDADESVAMQAPVAAWSLRGDPAQPSYELRALTPGLYLAVADATEERKRLSARRVLNVTESDIENFDFTLMPAAKWTGRLRAEDSGLRLESLRLSAEPRSDRSAVVTAEVREGGAFEIELQPGETYDLFVQNLPAGVYIRSIRAEGFEYLASGLQGAPPADIPLEVILSSKGASILGRVFTEEGAVATGASLMLIPDPPAGRLQSYRETLADEFAYFRMAGVPPGKYLLLAWWEEPPCDVFDLDEIDHCRALATTVTVSESGGATLPVVIRPARK
jgi:hypothetical protein